jgi:hypothetical protein
VVFIFLFCDALDPGVLCFGVPGLRADFGFSPSLNYRTVLFHVHGPDLLFWFSLLVFFSRSREELLIRVPAQGFSPLEVFSFPSAFCLAGDFLLLRCHRRPVGISCPSFLLPRRSCS